MPAATALLMKLLLDSLAAGTTNHLAEIAVLLGLIGLVSATVPLITDYIHEVMGRAVAAHAQDMLYAAVIRSQGLSLLETPSYLDRLRVAQHAATSVPHQFVGSLFRMTKGLVATISFAITLTVMNPWLALVVLVASVPAIFAQLQTSRSRARLQVSISPTMRRQMFFAALLQSPDAAKEIRLFGVGDFLRERMTRDLRLANDAQRRVDIRGLRRQLPWTAAGALLALLGLLWAVRIARTGGLTVGDLSMFVAALAGVQAGLTAAISSVGTMYQHSLTFGDYLAMLAMPPDLPSPDQPREPERLRCAVTFHDVWFRYSPDAPWSLRGATFTIEAGRATALVGLNGAGKSTVVKLLCRLYDPTRGTICWDGVDIKEFDIVALRRRIGAVFQDFMCYDLTAAENIAIGDLETLGQQCAVQTAASRAGVDQEIRRLPRGYETLLSRIFAGDGECDGPIALSGGQWQRVALARGLVRDRCDLLILDEPSAGLDAMAEQAMHEELLRKRQGATSVLISHRLSAVRSADQIFVLREGHIAECGTHDSLMAQAGEYAQLFAVQASGYRDDLAIRPASVGLAAPASTAIRQTQ